MDIPAYTDIGRPSHEFGAACVSPETYVGLMVQSFREHARRFPLKPCGTPHRELLAEYPLVSHGIWKVACSCSEHPIYSPEWGLACCFYCGAMYDGIQTPPGFAEIERLLLLRPRMEQRNWRHPETVETLRAENLEHGDPI